MPFTKFEEWQCEQEVRLWTSLTDKQDGLYYYDLGDDLQLREVIGGARCTVPLSGIERALGNLSGQVTKIKARAGFTKFEIVEEKRGWK